MSDRVAWIWELPKKDALSHLVALCASSAEQRARVTEAAEALGIQEADGETPHGNVLQILRAGPRSEEDKLILATLLAFRLAQPCKNDAAGGVGAATAHDGATANGTATAAPAAQALAPVAEASVDAILWLASFGPSSGTEAEHEAHATGELAPNPHRPWATALLAVTGLLLLGHVARLVGRFALGVRRPVEVSATPDRILVRTRTELFGRVLADRESILPRAAVLRATRELRYSGAATYAGLFCLAIGSYLGVGMTVDGARVVSPSLLLCGLLTIVMGLVLDFGLSTLVPHAREQTRLLVVPRKGAAFCVRGLDRQQADRLLTAFKGDGARP